FGETTNSAVSSDRAGPAPAAPDAALDHVERGGWWAEPLTRRSGRGTVDMHARRARDRWPGGRDPHEGPRAAGRSLGPPARGTDLPEPWVVPWRSGRSRSDDGLMWHPLRRPRGATYCPPRGRADAGAAVHADVGGGVLAELGQVEPGVFRVVARTPIRLLDRPM